MTAVVSVLRCVGLLLGQLLVFGLSQQVSAAPLVRIGTGEWVPYVGQQYADGGPLGRLVSAVFSRAGYKVEYQYYPWVRDVYLLKSGQLDAVMPYVCTPERQQFSLCAAPLVRTETVIFHRRDKPFSWHEFKDLQGYSMALTKGYSYGLSFDAARNTMGFNIQENSKEDAGMLLLLAGRVDLHLQDRAVGYAMLRREFSPQQQQLLTHNALPVSRAQLGLLFSKDARGEELRQAFNKALQPLQNNGDLQRLQESLERGDASSWQPHF